jgi:hypothetical protein
MKQKVLTQRIAIAFSRSQPDTQSGIGARPVANGYGIDIIQYKIAIFQDPLYQPYNICGMVALPFAMPGGDPEAVPGYHRDAGRAGGVKVQDNSHKRAAKIGRTLHLPYEQ